jgi:hypothetical protein
MGEVIGRRGVSAARPYTTIQGSRNAFQHLATAKQRPLYRFLLCCKLHSFR